MTNSRAAFVCLIASLALPVSADPVAAPVVPSAPAVAASTAAASGAPNGAPGMVNNGGLQLSKADLDALYKSDLKELENDLKEKLKLINSRFTRESELEQNLLEKKLAFRKSQQGELIAFEKGSIENWKNVMKRMREMEPVEALTERTVFDEKASNARSKFNEDAAAQARSFIDAQNSERDLFWKEVQTLANAAQRSAREHETKVGKKPSER